MKSSTWHPSLILIATTSLLCTGNPSTLLQWPGEELSPHISLTSDKSRTNFLITTSIDGHLKLWKKQEQGIEFVKHYRASLKAIVGVSVSDDGKLFATVSEGGEGRVFDVVNFGMFPYIPFAMTTLNISLYRHDKYPQIPIHTESMLLDT